MPQRVSASTLRRQGWALIAAPLSIGVCGVLELLLEDSLVTKIVLGLPAVLLTCAVAYGFTGFRRCLVEDHGLTRGAWALTFFTWLQILSAIVVVVKIVEPGQSQQIEPTVEPGLLAFRAVVMFPVVVLAVNVMRLPSPLYGLRRAFAVTLGLQAVTAFTVGRLESIRGLAVLANLVVMANILFRAADAAVPVADAAIPRDRVCLECQQNVPRDSAFCQFCGSSRLATAE